MLLVGDPADINDLTYVIRWDVIMYTDFMRILKISGIQYQKQVLCYTYWISKTQVVQVNSLRFLKCSQMPVWKYKGLLKSCPHAVGLLL